jgi:hypothetical protein
LEAQLSIVDLHGFTLKFGATGTTSTLASGTIDIHGGTNGGVLEFTAGTFAWSGGNITDSGSNVNAANEYFQSDSGTTVSITISASVLGAQWKIKGNANDNSTADITVAHKANIVIYGSLGPGTLSLNTDTGFAVNNDGAGTMTNSGTLIKPSGSGTSAIGLVFSNTMTGNFTIQSGTVNLTASGGATSTGTTTLVAANLTVSGTYSVNAGSFNGSGTLTGNLSNNASVHPGPVGLPGTLTITGTYTQAAAKNLGIDIDASGNIGQIADFSSMTLAGSVTVTRNVNYTPSSGTLTFLQATSFTGDFATKTINNNSWVAGDGNPYHFVFQKNAQTYTLVVTPGAAPSSSSDPIPALEAFFLLTRGDGTNNSAASPMTLSAVSEQKQSAGPAVDFVFMQPTKAAMDTALVGATGDPPLDMRSDDGFRPAESPWQLREIPPSLE